MKAHKLMFRNPEIKEGINTTMRRGVKWDINANKGDAVHITDQLGNLIKVGTVVYTQVFKFRDLQNNDYLLENQHDKLCRNYFGLCEAMNLVYTRFNYEEIITIITFEI